VRVVVVVVVVAHRTAAAAVMVVPLSSVQARVQSEDKDNRTLAFCTTPTTAVATMAATAAGPVAVDQAVQR